MVSVNIKHHAYLEHRQSPGARPGGGELLEAVMKKLAQTERSRAGRYSAGPERELDFFCFSCFPTAELGTIFLCDSILHSSWDSNCVVWWSLRNARRTLLLFSAVTAPGPRQPWSSRLAPISRFHSSVPLFPLVPVPNRPSRFCGRLWTLSCDFIAAHLNAGVILVVTVSV